MATTHGQPTLDLKAELLKDPKRFDFFQVVRLLLKEERLRIRPDVSMGFPGADVAALEKAAHSSDYVLTTSFFGLYGVSSPLPSFYTADLAKEDSPATRDFLDIFHHHLFNLLIQSWKKYRLFIQMADTPEEKLPSILYALGGLVDSDSGEIIRYSGLLGGRPRSALGLQTMLMECLQTECVEIIPFIPRAVRIPLDQQLRLGSAQNNLGQDSFVGEEFMDRQGKFRVRIGPLSEKPFRRLLPGGEDHAMLVEWVKRYLADPLDYDFELILESGQTHPICLGGATWCRLGLDTALFTDQLPQPMTVLFGGSPC